ncbi:MAG: hypothetical protein ACKVOU_13765 [Cytophagales bacterium]
MRVAEYKVYDIFRPRFSEQEADAILEYVAVANVEKLPSKEDFGDLSNLFKVEILRLEKEILDVKKDVEILKRDVNELRKDVNDHRKETAKQYADIIKWNFIFWIGQLAAQIAIIKFLVK